MTLFDVVWDLFSVPVTPRRWHLFEICDLEYIPSFIKHCCQNMLTAQWTHRLPLVQSHCPAELAARLLQRVLNDLEDIDTEEYTIIDFCSGAGGPVPYIEKSVNDKRSSHNQSPIRFRLSDIHPNLDAWIESSSHSANLSFIPQPVDATAPPPSVISKTASSSPSNPSAGTKTLHLFCLSFHHFSDDAAMRVLASTLATSDGFAIIELQDRSLGCVLLLTLEFWLLFLLTGLWFPRDWLHLAFTYALPVLPAVQCWDGVVSCLRTRNFGEVEALLERAAGAEEAKRGWRLQSARELHTWPFGYMNAVVGVKKSGRSSE